MTYYEVVANLDNWQGKFKDAFDAEYKNLEISRVANDSSNIASNLMSLANSYRIFGQTDSAMYYGRESSKWAIRFQAFNYPIFLVSMDHNKAPEARELWKKAVEYFKASVPPDFWYISDAINKSFEAMCKADTAAMIESIKEINKMPFQSESQNDYDLGRFLVLTGHAQEGLDYLNKLIKGESVTSTAFRYIQALYYIGRGYEDLGQNAEAGKAYEEFLNYWGKADMKFEMIDDARQRLAKLSS